MDHRTPIAAALPDRAPELRDPVPARIRALLAHWSARARQRRALAELDDRLLRDIGVSREAAQREARKPFWKD